MSHIKGFALVVVGILIFTGSCVFADETYSKAGKDVASGKDLKDRALALLDRLNICLLLVANDSGANTFDAQKVMVVQGPEFNGRFPLRDLQFQLEIIDVSEASATYTRSVAQGNPIQTAPPPAVVNEGDMVTLVSAATIKISPDEVHPARMILHVWEG
jgi:hypothetical protein